MTPAPMGGREVYFRLMRHVKAYWRPFAVAIFAMVVLGATEPAIPALLQKVINSFEVRNFDVVPWFAAALVGLFALRGAATFSTATGLAAVASRLVASLRERMFDKLLIVPARFYDAHNTGALMSKITYDSTQVTDAATQAVTVVVRDTLAIIGLLGWMFYLDWKLTLVALCSAPVVVFVVKYFSSRLRGVSRRMQEVMGEVTHVVEEVTGGQKVVRTFGAQEYERGRFFEAVSKARRYHLRFAATAAANSPIAQLATAITLAAILLIASRQFEAGTITIGGFVSFFTAMGMLFSPIKRLTGINGSLQRGIAAAQSVFQLIDETPEIDTGTRTVQRACGAVEFRNVSFRYETGAVPSLEDVSLRIEAGETVALVGPSGSGKTTFANLIPRFYARDAGTITIDDIDINELTLASLRAQIALVSQDVVLFNDTIAANIAYGRQDATH
ncbi:MAG: ABC transporter transmembrane domain-containing protein, partial [Gammaproteobacteria bacterium]